MSMEKRKCIICGKTFQPRRAQSLTCSPECCRKRDSEARREYYRNHKHIWEARYAAKHGRVIARKQRCEWCGKELPPDFDRRNKCCSPECKRAKTAHKKKCRLAKLRAENAAKNVRFCTVCGKEFHSQRGTAKYCSDKCKRKVHKARARERWRAMTADQKAYRNDRKKMFRGRVWSGQENYADCDMMGISRSTLDYVAEALFSD